jgi:hypothetical protein
MSMFLSVISGGRDMSAFDTSGPIRVVFMNPETHKQPLLVGVLPDPDQARRNVGDENVRMYGDVGVIGEASSLEALSDEDMSVLTALESLTEVEITLFMRELADAFRDEIANLVRSAGGADGADGGDADGADGGDADTSGGGAGTADSAGASATSVSGSRTREMFSQALAGALAAFFEECQRVIVRPMVVDGVGVLELNMVFAARGKVTAFSRAQRPADLSMLTALPGPIADHAYLAGALVTPPLVAVFRRAWLADSGATPQRTAALDGLVATLRGDLAARFPLAGGADQLLAIAAVSDGARALAGTRALAGHGESTRQTDAFAHRGVSVDVDRARSGAAKDESFTAAYGERLLWSHGVGASDALRTVIDALGGHPTPFEVRALREVVGRATTRGDSALFASGTSWAAMPGLGGMQAQIIAAGIAFSGPRVVVTVELLP